MSDRKGDHDRHPQRRQVERAALEMRVETIAIHLLDRRQPRSRRMCEAEMCGMERQGRGRGQGGRGEGTVEQVKKRADLG